MTKVYSSFLEFAIREDKSINGVSLTFAERHPNYEEDNATNVGCWNCAGCKYCNDCWDCVRCSECSRCASCSACINCIGCFRCGICNTCVDCIDCYRISCREGRKEESGSYKPKV